MTYGKTTLAFLVALAAALTVGACSDDDTESNPSFSASGGKASASGGSSSSGGTSGSGGAQGSGGKLSGSGGSGGSSSSGGSPSSGGASDTGGSSGSGGTDGGTDGGAEVPPYDCVLHPKTHLEIINACTDAVRITKPSTLPAPPGN